jgi:hypothetical protein
VKNIALTKKRRSTVRIKNGYKGYKGYKGLKPTAFQVNLALQIIGMSTAESNATAMAMRTHLAEAHAVLSAALECPGVGACAHGA